MILLWPSIAGLATAFKPVSARGSGVNFAFVKATGGGDLLDPMFPSHWTGSAAVGVWCGACHLFYHCRPAAEQAHPAITGGAEDRGADFHDDNDRGKLTGVTFWLRAVAIPVRQRYSGTGSVPGMEGNVDLNVFSGSARDWGAFVAGSAP